MFSWAVHGSSVLVTPFVCKTRVIVRSYAKVATLPGGRRDFDPRKAEENPTVFFVLNVRFYDDNKSCELKM